MTISFVGVGLPLWAETSTITPSLPAGVTTGDLILVFAEVAQATVTAMVLSSTGYTLRTVAADAGTGAPFSALAGPILYKVAGSSESNPVITNSTSSSNGWNVFSAAFRGVDTTTPFDVADVGTNHASGGTNTFTPTGVTTVTDGAVALSYCCLGQNDNALTVSTPQSFTTDASGASYKGVASTPNAGFDPAELALTHKLISPAGAVTCPTYNGPTDSPSAWVGITLALRPAAAALVTAPIVMLV